ncbi:MAG: AbrB/MazE/SpoVT family DNA-binding domain-containing protein [Nitrospiria bacterium]
MSDEGEITVVSAASSKTKSLRTTIPAGFVRQFGFDEGDKLSWKMEIINGDCDCP